MKIGFDKIDITPKEPVYMAGYGRKEKSKGVLDAIEINSAVLEISGKLLVLIVLDAIMLEKKFCDDIRNEVIKSIPTTKENVIISCTHTHSAPAFFKLTFENTVVEEALQNYAKEKMIASIKQSYSKLTECNIQFKTCMIDGLYGNRNVKEGWSDKSITVLEFYNNEQLIYSLLNISVHPTILDGSNFMLSGDLLGVLRKKYAAIIKAPVLIVNGTTGDVSTRFYRQRSGIEELEYVTDEIIKQLETKMIMKNISIAYNDATIVSYITHSNFSNDPTTLRLLQEDSKDNPNYFLQDRCKRKLELGKFDLELMSYIIKLGDLFIITLPGDVVSSFGKMIKESLEDYQVLIICYANSYCNYLVEQEQYGKYFETFNSRCNDGEADKFINNVIETAKNMI